MNPHRALRRYVFPDERVTLSIYVLAQELRGKKGEARARQVVETSLILLEGRAATSEKELDMLLEKLQEVSEVQRYSRVQSAFTSSPALLQRMYVYMYVCMLSSH